MPSAGKPQALNRYGYVFNRPLVYNDPSGYDPLDSAWEEAFRQAHGGRSPTDQDRQDRLLSLLLAGTGDEGTWTEDDWRRFSRDGNTFFRDPDSWNGEAVSGLAGFALLTHRFTHLYLPNETSQFVRAFALLFGDVAHDVPPVRAALGSFGGPQLAHLNLGSQGCNPALSEGTDDNPSLHYAELFFAGFFSGQGISNRIGDLREQYDSQPGFPWIRQLPTPDEADIRLGRIAINHGDQLGDWLARQLGTMPARLYDLGMWLRRDLR